MILQGIIKEAVVRITSKGNLDHINITGITDNSKDVKEGYLFVAVSGYSFDGHDYITEAIRLGASAVIGEQDIMDLEIPYIQVKNSRKVLGIVAKKFYGNPSSKKIMIGITGTNGKTTISFMLKHILEKNGISCSVIGTLSYIINGKTIESQNTTPGTIKLNSLLAESRDEVVIMEVSSHGLAQYRLEGIEFDYCVFTNLYHDHLDFHGTMEEYFQVKSLLFEKLKPNGLAVINVDNDWGENLYKNLHHKKVNTYLVGKSNDCDLSIIDYHTATNPFILLKEKEETVKIHLPLPGQHNLYNAAFAYAIARKLPIKREELILGLNQFPGVPGRFETYRSEEGITIVIDYAHTADAIFHTLQTAKECGAKRIFHIFGFRGGRDKTKREEMVKVSTEFSDELILTLDDLNTEKYDQMVTELNRLHSEYPSGKGSVIPDRTLAIQTAIQKGTKDDWLIITGKGPERYKQSFDLPTMSDKETILYLQENKNE
ncbi:UDP-N-acetylmuramoyl-L-alanyl-D-glutamate--2,6-diaminopimelate ligase [Bacillus sp. V3B]|uniref:UDP-N-acetylmuramoyl-L-alanyl-D-glutamate--2, 6-diaminopimelate ligase n=1 Tax=Bacillus sp. V3B TaxID=2804915 RepID=UPI00210D7ADB|nr:UDP-N-acetylmuramoyl-L-alanyl-D-glutamate--2,6-diaminopimelate ligase [Bacillus sp. V3B]MCQ6274802.1 UDP-N-acetylmuramoyl-L-alanyl-D-glutamate--2,6-diaminopimelate ligase [Bacillus sp. V3B]